MHSLYIYSLVAMVEQESEESRWSVIWNIGFGTLIPTAPLHPATLMARCPKFAQVVILMPTTFMNRIFKRQLHLFYEIFYKDISPGNAMVWSIKATMLPGQGPRKSTQVKYPPTCCVITMVVSLTEITLKFRHHWKIHKIIGTNT